MDDSDSDESERAHPDDTYVEATVLGKLQRGKNRMILMWTKVIQVQNTKTKTKTRTITAHSFPAMNFKIHKELEHLKRIISETPAEIDLINVDI